VKSKLEFIFVVSSCKNKVIVSSEIVKTGSANDSFRLFFSPDDAFSGNPDPAQLDAQKKCDEVNTQWSLIFHCFRSYLLAVNLKGNIC